MIRLRPVSGPDDPVLDEAAILLAEGQLVAFPTETVYGLGADGLNAEAVARIYAAKGRPATNPVILHVSGTEAATSLVTSWPQEAQLLAERFWPGPLTLILPAAEVVPSIVRAGGPTVALRCPDHWIAQQLIRRLGRPLAAPSANRSQHLSPTLAEHVASSLGGGVAMILDGGPTRAGLESTIVDLSGQRPRVLRPGPIGTETLRALLGSLDEWEGAVASGERQAAPGMAARHYAPRAHLALVTRGAVIAPSEERTAYVGFGTVPALPVGVFSLVLPLDPAAAGTRLYALLHELDDQGMERIFMELPPEDGAWDAVRDRLRRASAKEMP
jgi:L-threonylcarbamoyladenylate synthase